MQYTSSGMRYVCNDDGVPYRIEPIDPETSTTEEALEVLEAELDEYETGVSALSENFFDEFEERKYQLLRMLELFQIFTRNRIAQIVKASCDYQFSYELPPRTIDQLIIAEHSFVKVVDDLTRLHDEMSLRLNNCLDEISSYPKVDFKREYVESISEKGIVTFSEEGKR